MSFFYCIAEIQMTFFCALSQFDMLELDRLEKVLLPCPLLLDPDSYLPDTEDLTQDQPAREYWLDCFVDSIDKVCSKTFVELFTKQ